jgi:hypothetical protein
MGVGMRKAAIAIVILATGCIGSTRSGRIIGGADAIAVSIGIVLGTLISGGSDSRAGGGGPLCDPKDPRPPPHGCPALPGEPPRDAN